MRLRHKPWAKDKLAAHPEWVLTQATEKKGLWKQVFGNDHPLHIEVGMGKGQFVMGMAKRYPEINFVGIEVQESVIVMGLEKLLEDPLPNVRLIHTNGEDLDSLFEENEVDQVYLNFSDPWPKKKHAKRRLTHENFLRRYERVLKADGQLQLKTDNRGLFEYSLVSFSHYGALLDEVSLDLHELNDPDNVQTEYEERFSQMGHPIYRARLHFKRED
ncbi:tRNA (guanosine(46)-N7)-methyltransferase TrmB [Atopobacter sp. AH10]|uniref:tRNA (guanosine(46)-N7)-methyltransferase TrmB n=1 Tax=Atopobacter sp. AH10 TaxID=2315861 RepID=UPI000EF22FE3|nr:tRNA (guanosine(46)-N7)-methyltransferase TrmB [Atopobacter sp. AH10]RLK64139.1 tRNA (guanosine(46)-N7)-methyltransferase TrmB [Atopobacter sp. AH10]